MDEIVEEFKEESLGLVQDLIQVLEDVEDNPGEFKKLEEFGQKVDRIMGSSKTMVMTTDDPAEYEIIGQYAELCKSIGYKSSQISNNEQLVVVAVGLLFDATETLEKLIQLVGTEESLKRDQVISAPFLERLKWLSGQFGEGLRSSLALDKSEDSGQGSPGDEEEFTDINDVLDKFFGKA